MSRSHNFKLFTTFDIAKYTLYILVIETQQFISS